MIDTHILTVFLVCGSLSVGYAYWHLRASPVGLLRILLCIAAALMVGMVGSKSFAFALRELPLDSASWAAVMSSGLRHPGSIAALLMGMPIFIYWIVPKGWRLEMADAIAMAMLLCLPAYRIVCHINGCCIGGVCDQGYCITYPAMSHVYMEQIRAGLIVPGAAHSLAVFPLHAFIALSSALTFMILFWFNRHKDYAGQLVLLYLVINEGLKALLETWRVPFIVELQVASAIFAGIGVLGLVIFGWRHYRQGKAVQN